MYEIVMPYNQTLAVTAVFFISGIVHDYVLAFTMGFFCPATFILLFGIGTPIFFISKSKVVTNNIFWATEIRWMVVFWNFFEFGLSIFYEALIFDRVVVSIYHVFGTQYLEPKWFIKIVLESCIFILSLFFVVQYLVFQAWMNAWAEMLRFADRLFYKDWWNAKTINEFFRNWNLIVHIWLYTYIYKEVYKFGASQNRTLAATAVFFISAIVHEYVLAFTMGFFYPVTFILFFGIGVPLFIVSKSKVVTSNFFLWILFNIDAMIMFNSYSMELNARWNNCPPHPNYYLDLLIPRSWSCQQQFNPLFTSTVKSCNETMDFSVTNY